MLGVATAFGFVAGLVQTLGFLRWPFLVPYLAQAYLAPGANEAQRTTAAFVFEAFHRHLGMGVGEHLGYLSTSIWTLLIMVRTAFVPRWFGVMGVVLAIGIAAGLGEPVGWDLGGTINAPCYLGWSVCLIACGVILIFRAGGVTMSPSANTPIPHGATI